MLVRDADGGNRLAPLAFLAQRLGPELGEPVTETGPQGNVGEKDHLIKSLVEERRTPCRQLKRTVPHQLLSGQFRIGKRGCHFLCSGHERIYVHAKEQGRDQTDRRQHGIASAEIVRYRKRRNVVLVRFATQETLFLIGHEQHVFEPCIAKVFLHPLLENEILANGFNGAAGFGHGDDHGLCGFELGEIRLKGIGIHVVRYPEARPGMSGLVLLRIDACCKARAPRAEPPIPSSSM